MEPLLLLMHSLQPVSVQLLLILSALHLSIRQDAWHANYINFKSVCIPCIINGLTCRCLLQSPLVSRPQQHLHCGLRSIWLRNKLCHWWLKGCSDSPPPKAWQESTLMKLMLFTPLTAWMLRYVCCAGTVDMSGGNGTSLFRPHPQMRRHANQFVH